MVNLTDIIASNERIPSALPPGLVAVFVGGTSGVGEYTLKAFARYARAPKAIVVGRSQEAADRILNECRRLNPDGHFEFIRADVSLLKNVDDVCRQIKEKVSVINVLFESQGSMAFHSESRLATPRRQRRGSDIRRRHRPEQYPRQRIPTDEVRDQVASIGTLMLEEAQRRASDVAFIHTVPGVVESGIMRDVQPTLGISIIIGLSRLLRPFISVPPTECGERHVFAATSAAFPPGQGTSYAGVPLGGISLKTSRGTNGRTGSGVYSLSQKDEPASSNVEELLRRFREDGTAKIIWDSVAADFKRITGPEVAA
ncbi:hypothetical protein E0Z10_g5351 [Xylaria hypoxylon]|uniref:Ketoreductase (KR) domain-containing protein n=1 Tax=Xylaria hypoxylon TaxID=37992 RepID=A0A4Z0YGF8_9PEZI|nr:hypothetical protein E0Z10_g5351 [Xylaria hypoxylon]